MLEKNPDTVKLVFKHFPLRFHKEAIPAAQASIAAQMQGRFWQYHDKLFATKNLNAGAYKKIAQELGLDMAKFEADTVSVRTRQQIMSDMQNGRIAEVSGTPAIFVNGWRYMGPRTPQAFQKMVDKELATIKANK